VSVEQPRLEARPPEGSGPTSLSAPVSLSLPPSRDPSTADEPASIDVRSVLNAAEVGSARVFFRIIAAIALLTGCFMPLLAGALWLRALSAASCMTVAALAGLALHALRRPEGYTSRLATSVGAVSGALGVVIMYYIGPFSAGVMILTLGIYFFGTSNSRPAARATYLTIALLYLAASAGIASGLLADRALFSTAYAQPFTRWFQVLMSQVIFALTFYLARSSRRTTEAAIDEAAQAQSQVRARETLLEEAHVELASALHPTGGRHTGKTAGSFRIGALLGRGSMGEVYRGTDPDGSEVAVKILHPNLVESPERVKRFLREAEVAAAVDSRHIPKIHGTGWIDDGCTPFVAMELLEGHDLGWHLRKTGRLSISRVVDLCEQVAAALADVRAAGVVHRDLKPGNLFLSATEPPTWKVLDFGLSKLLSETGSLTRDHAIGTPAYMAPEQVKGPSSVDHRADLYALAAISYRALTGVPPFAGDDVATVLFQVMYQQPAAPRKHVHLPIDVELVLAIGMAKRREDRFANAGQLAAAMRAAHEGELDDDMRARGWTLLRTMPWGSRAQPAARGRRAPKTA
jgi:eukaryotic-like serine/threonine-protein kinase